MRFVFTLLMALVVSGWVLTRIPQEVRPQANPSPWRRTAAGWERLEEWVPPTGSPYRLNPLLVAALQVGISLTALVAARNAKNPDELHPDGGGRT